MSILSKNATVRCVKILGIETSCDETAISVVEAEGDLKSLHFRLLGSAIHSQIKIHEQYGGVFPTLAKREHTKNLPIVLEEALQKAGIKNPKEELNLIVVTVGPGLEPALWTGITFAEKLGEEWGLEVVPTNHMLGHIASVLFNKTDELGSEESKVKSKDKIEFPALALLISGGHTELVMMDDWIHRKKIGETVDDAVGEAFDKVARMLGLPYPGGPQISKLAKQAREQGISSNKKLPRPMIHSGDYNFSFSGLKTAVLYYLRDNPEAEKLEVAREFEDAVIETLLSKTERAIEEYAPKTLIIGGGVIANEALRAEFDKLQERYGDLKILIPEKSLTTDNATMIAAAGYIDYLNKTHLALKAEGKLSV